MGTNPITVPLPADLPTDWSYGQTVGPDGTDVGLTEQHGYNYLMEQVNNAQTAASQVGKAVEDLDTENILTFQPTEEAPLPPLPLDADMLNGQPPEYYAKAVDTVAEYTHQKSGTTHTLTGLAGAQCIRWVMSATAEYGDSWTLNGEPVVVVYCDGNPILPHWLVAGDLLLGIVSAGKITLTIPTPKPNENLLDNWYFADPINQRGQTEYTEGGYTIDRWILWGTDGTVAL